MGHISIEGCLICFCNHDFSLLISNYNSQTFCSTLTVGSCIQFTLNQFGEGGDHCWVFFVLLVVSSSSDFWCTLLSAATYVSACTTKNWGSIIVFSKICLFLADQENHNKTLTVVPQTSWSWESLGASCLLPTKGLLFIKTFVPLLSKRRPLGKMYHHIQNPKLLWPKRNSDSTVMKNVNMRKIQVLIWCGEWRTWKALSKNSYKPSRFIQVVHKELTRAWCREKQDCSTYPIMYFIQYDSESAL